MEVENAENRLQNGRSPVIETAEDQPVEARPQGATERAIPQTALPETASRSKEDMNPTFGARLADYQLQLSNEFQEFEKSLSQRPKDHELESMDWNDLAERYDREMSVQIAAEQDIMNEFSARFRQFMLWMQVSNEREAERALKRLRTRTTFVQHSEEQLNAKQEHYAKVLGAFQDAMALLRNL